MAWCPEQTFIKSQNSADLRCASSDLAGNIIVWNVLAGKSATTMKNATTIAIGNAQDKTRGVDFFGPFLEALL